MDFHRQRKKQRSKIYVKINSKWILDVNIKGKTIKMLQENTGENLCDLGLSKEFLDMTPKQDLQEKKS